MRQRTLYWLIAILILAAILIWVDMPSNPGIHLKDVLGSGINIDRDFIIRQGLDLKGGVRVLLEADMPQAPAADALEQARVIVENRVNALGVTEPVVQTQGDRRIIVELPGVEDPDQAIATIRETALLEFVDAGLEGIPEGSRIRTTIETVGGQTVVPTATATITPTGGITPTGTLTGTQPLTATNVITNRVFTTIIQGSDLDVVQPAVGQLNEPEVRFTLKPEGSTKFAQFTAQHNEQTLGQRYYLCIVLDKTVISCPSVRQPISQGQGVITLGTKSTMADAEKLSLQLHYGALPVPLRVESFSTVGPTLGQISIEKSTRAGIIGVLVVLMFMLIYYRFPGFLADLALIVYMLINFGVYKIGIPSSIVLFPLVPVTLTLPGIAGFLLSTGMAVDANILIFERMKEELRGGRSMTAAVEAGFDRAWTAIRDSNLSTLLTCVILYVFGSNFGASVVKGFAITLFLGVLISMFTAVVVTRTFLRTAMELAGEKLHNQHWLMGV
jgi:protein-export membrane protein SecD